MPRVHNALARQFTHLAGVAESTRNLAYERINDGRVMGTEVGFSLVHIDIWDDQSFDANLDHVAWYEFFPASCFDLPIQLDFACLDQDFCLAAGSNNP